MRQRQFTFILPAYKPQYLHEAISSILAQSYRWLKLVVIDDCSPYDLAGVVASTDDQRLTYIRLSENRGGKDLVQHWNYCLDLCDTEYVVIASDDDIYYPDFLMHVNQLIDRYPKVDIFSARFRRVCEGRVFNIQQPLGQYLDYEQFIDAYCDNRILSGLQNHVYRTSALRRIGGIVNFKLAWFSDDATTLALAAGGIVFTDDVLFDFRFSDSNISSIQADEAVLRKKLIANDEYYLWVKLHLPLIVKDINPAIGSDTLARCESRLLAYVKTSIGRYIFDSPTALLWRVRDVGSRLHFLSPCQYYGIVSKSLWRNYSFVVSPRWWMTRFSRSH